MIFLPTTPVLWSPPERLLWVPRWLLEPVFRMQDEPVPVYFYSSWRPISLWAAGCIQRVVREDNPNALFTIHLRPGTGT